MKRSCEVISKTQELMLGMRLELHDGFPADYNPVCPGAGIRLLSASLQAHFSQHEA